MNGAHGRPIRKFNPGTLQSDGEVIRQFVVRQRELDLVLEVVRGNLDSPSCQHVLIVAPRGRGKTMLLARIGAELRTNDDLSRRLFPVRFMEESQEIFTLADFWLESLFYLAQACAHDDPEHSRELLATHAELTARWNDTNIEERAHAAVLEAADRLSKTLVLMVENLQALCGAVDDDFGWKLRKTLQSEPQIMLLATATSRFKGLDDAEQPFFELFRIVNLEPLDTDECQRLWYMVSGDASKRREIEPLRILTGGSPRLLVIVAEFARHRSLRQLLEELVTLIDNHTEYFRGHLEVLSKTERRVYLAVIDLWQPSSSGEIAERARMEIRVVSALLGRLVDRGAVLVDGTGRKRWYAAAERLYSIYYKLRRERDEAAIVHYLIQFMTTFYSDDELAALAVSDRGEARLGISDAPDLQLEVAKVLVNKGITHGQRDEAEEELAAYDAVAERFGASDAPDIQTQVARALLFKGITHGQRDEAEEELAAYDALVARFGASDAPDIQTQVAKALLFKGITHGQRDEAEEELAAYDALVERFGASDAPDIQVRVAKALLFKGITHGQRDEAEEELAAYDALVERFGASDAPDIQVRVAKALLFKGITHGQRDEAEEELAAYDALVERFGASDAPDIQTQVARALLFKGITHGQRDEAEEALAAYDALVERFGASDAPDIQVGVARALLNKGITHGQRDEAEEELAAYDALVERFGASDAPDIQVGVAKALLNKGITHGQRDEAEEELAAYDALVERFGASDAPDIQTQVARALLNKGITHGQRDEAEEELAAYDALVERFGASDAPDIQVRVAKALLNKGITHGQRDEAEEALAAYDALVERFGASDAPDIQVQVAKALFVKGITHGQRDEAEEELAAYDALVERFGASDAPDIQVRVAKALVAKGDRLIEIGRAEEALRTSDELERRCGAFTDNAPVAFALWRAKWMRTHALIVQEEHQSALSVLRSVCAMFVVDDAPMLREMLARVPTLIAAGAAARDIVEILSADRKKADAVAPLVVALRQLAGESVRESAEVLEVAAAVRKRIEATRTAWRSSRLSSGSTGAGTFALLWGKSPALAKRFETRAEAAAALEEVGETVYGVKVERKDVGTVMVQGREHPIVIVDLDDGRRFFLESV